MVQLNIRFLNVKAAVFRSSGEVRCDEGCILKFQVPQTLS
jgi:hypothetical protein